LQQNGVRSCVAFCNNAGSPTGIDHDYRMRAAGLESVGTVVVRLNGFVAKRNARPDPEW